MARFLTAPRRATPWAWANGSRLLDTPALAGGTLGALFNQDMGELLVKTRQAADAVGATPMDRPEWITTHPVTREAYVTLTNNSSRGSGNDRYPGTKHPGPNDANPRANNVYGQIVRWREKSGDPASLSFEWDIFVLAGNPTLYPRTDLRSGSANVTAENTFTAPTAWLSTSAACCGSRPTATTPTPARTPARATTRCWSPTRAARKSAAS